MQYFNVSIKMIKIDSVLFIFCFSLKTLLLPLSSSRSPLWLSRRSNSCNWCIRLRLLLPACPFQLDSVESFAPQNCPQPMFSFFCCFCIHLKIHFNEIKSKTWNNWTSLTKCANRHLVWCIVLLPVDSFGFDLSNWISFVRNELPKFFGLFSFRPKICHLSL